MALRAHLKELRNKHAKLDEQIKQEHKSPFPDSTRLTALKKQKLLLKEQIVAHQTA